MSDLNGSNLRFNTQPPEGGCWDIMKDCRDYDHVSTHSRPKAAEKMVYKNMFKYLMITFQHTAARRRLI